MHLILHIGTEKTGTTLLQQWLTVNRAALSAQGVCFSNAFGAPAHGRFVAYFQSPNTRRPIIRHIRDEKSKSDFFRGFEKKITREIAKARRSHHSMIITSEFFHSRLREPSEIEALRDFLHQHFKSIKVICYFREQGDMRESLYSTSLKVGGAGRLENFQEDEDETSHYYNFFNLASLWSDVFGRDAMDFRIYDRNAFVDGDIRKDFLTAIPQPVNTSALDFSLTSANESLSYLQAVAFRAINESTPFWLGGVRNPANTMIRKMAFECDALKVGTVVDQKKKEFTQRFEKSNQLFLSTFFSPETRFPTNVSRSNPDDQSTYSLEDVGQIVEGIFLALSENLGDKLRQSRGAKRPKNSLDLFRLNRKPRGKSDGLRGHARSVTTSNNYRSLRRAAQKIRRLFRR